jgi:predicted dehydrogenase
VMATVRAGPTYWRLHVFGTKGWAEALGETKVTVAPLGQEPQTTTLPVTDSLAALLDRFADAVEGGAPFPVAPEQMLDVVGAFEALVASIGTGRPVTVAAKSGNRFSEKIMLKEDLQANKDAAPLARRSAADAKYVYLK